MKMKVYLKFLPLLLSLILSSCLSVTTVLEHKSSGSGTLALDYQINKKSAGIQKDAVTSESLIPLPVNEADFQQMAASRSGITVRDYSESEDSDYIYIQAELDYESPEDLGAILGIPVNYSDAEVKRLEMTFLEPDVEMDPESLAILASLFAEDRLVFELNFPSAVRSSNFGSVNGRQVSFDTALADVYGSGGFVWTVEW